MIQSTFGLPAAEKLTTCNVCGMTYQKLAKRDQDLHKKYHYTFVQGPKIDMGSQVPLSSSRLVLKNVSFDCKIYDVQKDLKKMVQKAEGILAMVNQDLNAPKENPAWKKRRGTAIEGKAFIMVINQRVVSLCATEPITDAKKQTRWMIHRTQEVVPQQRNLNCKLGISRIWVASHWRRNGLGMMMLNLVTKRLVYGMTLGKMELAFSQPSYSGGLLAKRFCGIKHKSGEILVPIYLEED